MTAGEWLTAGGDVHSIAKCVLVVFPVYSNAIENISRYVQLGRNIISSFTGTDDIINRHNCFIGQSNNLLSFFNKLDIIV